MLVSLCIQEKICLDHILEVDQTVFLKVQVRHEQLRQNFFVIFFKEALRLAMIF